MKVLTIKQPWATLIMWQDKFYEIKCNTTKNHTIGQKILPHNENNYGM